MHSDAFDVIPFQDIKGDWKKLGSGSFGNVYKGTYLGIEVAIKEVLPSNDYDVAKYFEREWRLMKEARHPNVVLYLGLSRAPDPDGRIFIISEFIENGNLRSYIHDKSKPFPWRLRLSFATDIARALAYLHARRCIHRDLKGENLLVTTNGRLKITDFGFARIAARNDDESKRLTFCGTDSYMSPEILLGNEFDLPTDIFSLGVIFCEIAARKLADDRHFSRSAPFFDLDISEVRERASPGCPAAFIELSIACVNQDPARRPTTRTILDRLREIEADVLSRPSEVDDLHVGSVKFMTGGKRPSAAPRIPSFGMGVASNLPHRTPPRESLSEEDTDDELAEAVMGLSNVNITSTWSESNSASTGHTTESSQPLIDSPPSVYSDYSTAVVRQPHSNGPVPPSLSSILTIRASPNPSVPATAARPHSPDDYNPESAFTIDSYRTAHSSIAPSSAAATEGGSTVRGRPSTLVHRFTLLKPGAKRSGGTASPPQRPLSTDAAWNPFELIFSSGLLTAKCDICNKRLGWKPVLECDDCGLRTHIKCGELAPRDCGLHPPRHAAHHALHSVSAFPTKSKTK